MEEARFTDIRLSNNCTRDPFTKDPSFLIRGNPLLHLADHSLQVSLHLPKSNGLDFLLWKIDVGFDQGQVLYQPCFEFGHFSIQPSSQLLVGDLKACLCFCPDQINHSLSPGEIYSAIEKGPLRKLSWLGHPGPLFQHQLQHHLQNEVPPMTVALHNMFSGISLWRFHQNDQHFINRISTLIVNDFPIMKLMGNKPELVFLGLK